MDTPMSDLRERRLHRSRTDRVVFGVCGGLAEYFEIDPVLVRLLFVIVTLAGGAGVLAYIILAIVLPEEGAEPLPGREGLRRNVESLRTSADGLGTPFVEGGAADTTPGAIGGERRRHRSNEVGALILIGIGLLFLAGNTGWFGWFRWDFYWPVILIVVGAALLFRRRDRIA